METAPAPANDRDMIDRILDAAVMAQLALTRDDGRPSVVPVLHARAGDELLLRLCGPLEVVAGTPASAAVTLLDGLERLAHRTVVVAGRVRPITDPEEKRSALRAVTERLSPGRPDTVPASAADELEAVAIVALPLAAATVRTGSPGVEAEATGREPPPGWSGARRPQRSVALPGERVRLEALDPAAHATALHAAAAGGDPRLWDYMPYGPFPDAAAYRAWAEREACGEDPLFYVVVDAASGRPGGVASYLNVAAASGSIEIGHIWFGAALQRTPQATEAIYLLARHAFDELGYRRLEWKCNARNARSRGAARRFGFSYEGVFRQHMVHKGRNRDSAWYSMLDHEWPRIRAAFERWLEPGNFAPDGSQRTPLAARAS